MTILNCIVGLLVAVIANPRGGMFISVVHYSSPALQQTVTIHQASSPPFGLIGNDRIQTQNGDKRSDTRRNKTTMLNLKGSITGFFGFFSLWVLEEEEESDGFWRLGRMKSNFFYLCYVNFYVVVKLLILL